jgi:predicted N-acetyltransferase YhbS
MPATQLVARLRADPCWLPALSLLAIAEDIVIGHVVCTRGHVDDAPALGLAPISVLPECQGRGVGHALMHAVLGAAEATDEPLVRLLGEPAPRLRARLGAGDRRAQSPLGQLLPGTPPGYLDTRDDGHLPLRLDLY